MASIRELIEEELIPKVNSENPQGIARKIIAGYGHLAYNELAALETSLRSELQMHSSKQTLDLYYTILFQECMKASFTYETVAVSAKALAYIGGEIPGISTESFNIFIDTFMGRLTSEKDPSKIAEYSKILRNVEESYGPSSVSAAKNLLEVRFKPIAWQLTSEADFSRTLEILSNSYDLEDAGINISIVRGLLLARVNEILSIARDNEEIVQILSEARLVNPHPQVANILQELSSQHGIIHSDPEPSTFDRIQKKDILFKEHLYTFPHGSHKIEIRKAIYKDNLVAVKIYKSNNESIVDEVNKEVQALETLSNKKGFLTYYGRYYSTPDFWEEEYTIELGIIMEFCPKTLEKDIQEHIILDRKFSATEMENAVKGLLEGFYYLKATENVLHRDIKPDNIMISTTGDLKIIDFNSFHLTEGTATISPTVSYSTTGTIDYMSPEQREGYMSGSTAAGTEEAADVFSLGLTILRMETLESISNFNTKQGESLLPKAINKVRFAWLKQLLSLMLAFNFRERKSFRKLLSLLPTSATVQEW